MMLFKLSLISVNFFWIPKTIDEGANLLSLGISGLIKISIALWKNLFLKIIL